jgi:hypothetical protein
MPPQVAERINRFFSNSVPIDEDSNKRFIFSHLAILRGIIFIVMIGSFRKSFN